MAPAALASIPTQLFDPDETPGEFIGRFIETTEGKPPALVAAAVWRLCDRAWRDGRDEGARGAAGPIGD